ncbi:conserved hypothetical protein [Hyella patelloides LEGE 07179]|uniref:Peptidase metallopeptidase domain-containing protein n=1 Tax=Hyella patelloides LEGE 07179 TaxID=945734 RepID=A0A563VSU3_9CYAN|nr:peptidase [Hyella patelloides]VEP14349.1 conserved hypothetical protein [Hyella patelloides LEGE 07179]
MLNVKINQWLIGFTTVCLLCFFSTSKTFEYFPLTFFPSTFSHAQSAPLKPHPLPPSLAKWNDVDRQGDYFELIQTTPVGYLIWSQFPIAVYVEQPSGLQDNSAQGVRFQQWVNAVAKAIAEWNLYLPLQEINQPELADIVIVSSSIDRKIQLNPDTGLYDIPQAITAQTNYEFYVREEQQKVLAHKMTIKISPDLSPLATLAAARHELGHGLGIWGHSDRQSDALYFSQVRDTPTISVRDINTLKKIYQQPTKLGWKI